MLSLESIAKFYPAELHPFSSFLIREYLQHKILEAVFQSAHARKLVFIGGTCLRILHDNQRFSEDIDFDNVSCSQNDWVDLSTIIKKRLQEEGYEVEIKVVSRKAWHCYIRFPGILFKEAISGYRQEKILIQLDSEPQDYAYEPNSFLLNRFDVFTELFCASLPLLMAHKCHAILNRIRNKGRDFFDLAFLMGLQVQPDWDFLQQKDGIRDALALRHALLLQCSTLDMNEMARDTAPFLFNTSGEQKVLQFEKLVQQYF